MSTKQFITTQALLAKAVGCTPQHLSLFRHRKTGGSKRLVNNLHTVTGISVYDLVRASDKKIAALFERFFDKQRAAREKALS